MACLFKVWCSKRLQKSSIIAEPTVAAIILKANKKLNLKGDALVYEADGTNVDDETLEFIISETRRPHEIFMLLEPRQTWTPLMAEIAQNPEFSAVAITGDSNSEINSPEIKRFKKAEEENSGQHCTVESNVDTLNDTLPSPTENPTAWEIPPPLTSFDWNEFHIKWPSKGEPFRDALDDAVRDKYLVNTFVQTVVSQMRQFSPTVLGEAYEIVAKKMVEAFPRTFCDYFEGGEVFRQGYAVIKEKLKNRNNYLLRFQRGLNKELEIPLNAQKLLLSAKGPCARWQPDAHPEDETAESLLEAEASLFATVTSEDFGEVSFEEKIFIFKKLECTYAAKRFFLNTIPHIPTAVAIKEKWPILLIKDFMFWHYETLMGQIISQLEDAILNSYDKIFTFHQLKIKKEDPKKKTATINGDKQTKAKGLTPFDRVTDTDAIFDQVFEMISEHFQENVDSIFLLCESINDSADFVLPQYPCVLRKGENNCRYYLIIDNVECQGISDLGEVLKMFIASYYVFYRMFPDCFATTMQFIQECFMKIESKEGSKCRQNTRVHKKVMGLFNKLRDVNVPSSKC